MKTHILEAHAERLADQRIWRRLSTDPAYQNAADAESQAERGDKIGFEVWTEIEKDYEIDS